MVVTEQLGQQSEQGIAGVHAPAEFRNGFAAMPRLLPFDQHGAIAQRQAEGIELATDRVIGAPVNDAQVGNTRLELTAEGELDRMGIRRRR